MIAVDSQFPRLFDNRAPTVLYKTCTLALKAPTFNQTLNARVEISNHCQYDLTHMFKSDSLKNTFLAIQYQMALA